jgi:purine-binding chemotaxis protein CheW
MGEELKVIVFTLAHEQYGVEVENVKTIERIQPLTRVPRTPPFVKGVINLRGVVVPVIDLRGRFGLPESDYTNDSRIIIVNVGAIEVGLIVDSASDVVDVDSDSIVDPPEVVGGIKAKYLRGVAKIADDRLLVMLNLQEVLNKNEIVQLDEIGE